MAPTPTFRENFLRVIAVIGLIAILLLGAWGIIQLAFYLPTFFGSIGQTKETLTASAPAQSVSDKAFPLSWKHAGKDGEYSYAVSYACSPGLAFAAPVPTGAFQLVKCDTPFNYVNATSSMPIIPVLAPGVKEASTTLTVAATRLSDGTIAVKGTAKTTVSASTTPAAAPAAPAEPKPAAPAAKPVTPAKPATTYVPSGRTQNLYGAPDLAVQITAAPTQAQAGSRISLQFVITNIGTNAAPAGWTFNAVLPYQPLYVYPSGGQQMLYPGDRIVYTLGYDVMPAQGGYYGGQAQATIEVDPMNQVQESSDYNNTAVTTYQVF